MTNNQQLTKEQIAHDLAISYEQYCALRSEHEFLNHIQFFDNYEKAYKEFLNLIED